MTNEALKRFWAKVDLSNPRDCWNWIGAAHESGYGAFSINHKTVYAHRLVWEIANGPIQNGLFVCHHCDNPACVNPKHLFLGTARDNYEDSAIKGRCRGTHRPKTQIPTGLLKKLRTIREIYGISQVQLGSMIDKNSSLISLIETGKVIPTPDELSRIKAALNWPSDEAVEAAFQLLQGEPAQ